ncbi:MAG TPA: disulfide bond formation protein DsbA [Gammaproteobacteria bacterium]|nr:disulfide bond formation protein DsbA [Gammaproteobacteria bacterium]HIL96986.1 disulfide bond formation protein DsbA [Pseudomonadales bacterium]
MSQPLVIDYYSDVLCVWAWIAQRRLDELQTQWGDKIQVRHHYLNLFGDTRTRMQKQWGEKGGYTGFAEHVLTSASPFENAPVNPLIWQQNQPLTSANAHLLLKAVSIIHGEHKETEFALNLRQKFFIDAVNIGEMGVLKSLAEDEGFDVHSLQQVTDSGQAPAALMTDYQAALDQGIKGSPSWVMDNGRQILYGNVGYRVLQANVEELINQPQQEASWC